MSITESTEVLIEAYEASGKTKGFELLQVSQFTDEVEEVVKESKNPMERMKEVSEEIYRILGKAPEPLVQAVQSCLEYVSNIIKVEKKIGPILDPIPECLARQKFAPFTFPFE